MKEGDYGKYNICPLTEEQKERIKKSFDKMDLDSNMNYNLLDMGLYDENTGRTTAFLIPDERPIVIRFE